VPSATVSQLDFQDFDWGSLLQETRRHDAQTAPITCAFDAILFGSVAPISRPHRVVGLRWQSAKPLISMPT
jgi:hypothetical protein